MSLKTIRRRRIASGVDCKPRRTMTH